MDELTALDRLVLAAIGNEGLPYRAIRQLAEPTVLERLCDAGYIWACAPDHGPYYQLSDRGEEALARDRISAAP